MKKYIIRRIIFGIITVWFIATATFFAMRVAFKDPTVAEKAVSEEVMKNLKKKWGLDQPLHMQYLIYMKNLCKGDLGMSMWQENRSVNDIIKDHFPVSALLGIYAMLIAAFGGILWGAITAKYRNKLPDIVIMFLVIIGISVPNFVLASASQLVILEVNQATGKKFPIIGLEMWYSYIVPSIVLGMGTMAYLTRLMRSSMLEVVNSDYIRTARAKGLSPVKIFFSHELRNAILPVITVLGPSIAAVTTGSFVVEKIFGIPGLGKKFVDAVLQQDYTLLMGVTIFYGAFLVVMVLIVDIIYGFIDPRIRVDK